MPRRRSDLKATEPTIYDVAGRAGVAISTVSLALRGDPRVREATRKAVAAAAKSLRYQPNISARDLARRHTNLVAVFGWFRPDSLDANWFPALQMLMGIQERLRGTDYATYLVNWSNPPDEHLAALREFERRRFIAGSIWLSSSLPRREAAFLRRARLPVVLVEASQPGVDSVEADNALGGYLGAKHLLGLGRGRLALVSGLPGLVQDSRLRGCGLALREAGGAGGRVWRLALSGGSFNEGLAATSKVLRWIGRDRSPVSVFCPAGDKVALGILAGLRAAGVRIPEQAALVGFDDQPETAYSVPAMTTVEQPLLEMGRQAATFLLDRLEGRSGAARRVQLLPRLIRRDSA